jgi:hypothetical protein
MFKSIEKLASQQKKQCPTFLDAITTTTSKHYCFINPIPLMHLLILAFLQSFKALKNSHQ